jgi:hypothetical protein
MLTRTSSAFALACLFAGTLYAADDPFCGKWKFNQQKSKVTGYQMKVEDVGNNALKFDDGNATDTVTMDGTDQSIHYGQTMSLTKEGPHALKMIIKKDGKVMSSMTHTLSDNGNTQTIEGTRYKPDGTQSDFKVVEKRVGSGSGWAGTWQTTNVDFGPPVEWDIIPTVIMALLSMRLNTRTP